VVATATAPLASWNATSGANQAGASGWQIGDLHREGGFGGAWGLVSDAERLSLGATAVPEPGSWAVLGGLGLLGFAVSRRLRAG
jgi:hypothetical protein